MTMVGISQRHRKADLAPEGLPQLKRRTGLRSKPQAFPWRHGIEKMTGSLLTVTVSLGECARRFFLAPEANFASISEGGNVICQVRGTLRGRDVVCQANCKDTRRSRSMVTSTGRRSGQSRTGHYFAPLRQACRKLCSISAFGEP